MVCCAALEVEKWINSVLSRSNSLACSCALEYSLAVSLSRILTFFLMLVDALDMDMSSAKDQKVTLLELKRELM